MVYLFILIFGVVMIGLALDKKDNNIIQLSVISLSLYFVIYVLFCGLLFWFDCYNMGMATIGTSGICFVLLLVSVWKNRVWKIQGDLVVELPARENRLPYLTILLVCICAAGHFEFYGMGQDEGVYQNKAINLMMGMTQKTQTVPELDALEEGEYKEFYQEEIDKLHGYDIKARSVDVPGVTASSESEAYWHGIPIYPAMLALSARIFGISNMMVVNTAFFVCFLFVMQFILSEWKVKPVLQSLLLILAGLSPQMLWVKKSTLTESFLALLIVLYLYFLLGEQENRRWISVLPIAAFCFFHVSAFVMMPAFIGIYWILFFKDGKSSYLAYAQCSIVTYLAGYLMMVTVQPVYTLTNYFRNVYIVSQDNMTFVVWMVCIVVSLVNTAIWKWGKSFGKLDKVFKWYLQIISIASIVCLIIGFVSGKFSLEAPVRATLLAYGALTGIFLLPSILVCLIIRKYRMSNQFMVMATFFSWCILIYSMVMRTNISFFYYYGRYLVPFLGVIILLFAYLVKDCIRIIYLLPLTGIAILFPYTKVIVDNQDDSLVEWNVLEELVDELAEEKIILLDQDLMMTLFFPLQAGTDAAVYPVINESIPETLSAINIPADEVVYVSKDILTEENSWVADILSRRTCYSQQQADPVMEEETLGLPIAMPEPVEYTLSVYTVEKETLVVICTDEEHMLSGWSGISPSGYRWMTSTAAFMSFYLSKEDYTMYVCTGDAIPFAQLETDKIEVEVYVNSTYVTTLEYSEEIVNEIHPVSLSADILNEGYNEVCFVSDLWSPKEYGSKDRSEYGFSMYCLQFVAEE